MLQSLWTSPSFHSFIFSPFYFTLNSFVLLPHFPSDTWFKLFWHLLEAPWLAGNHHWIMTKKWNTRGAYRNYFDLLLFWQIEHLRGNKAVWKIKLRKKTQKNKEGNHENA